MYRNRRYSDPDMQRYDCRECGTKLPIQTFPIGSQVQLLQFGMVVKGDGCDRSVGVISGILKKPVKDMTGRVRYHQRYAVIRWPDGRTSERSLVRLRQVSDPSQPRLAT
jgi:hypothetical protein